MTTKPLVKHFFTFTTPTQEGRTFPERFDYRVHKNFWSLNHPLHDVLVELLKLTPATTSCPNPHNSVLQFINNIYYDLYNNGGGNASRWIITTPFKKCIRRAKLPKEEILSLENRLSEVFVFVGKGKNFGWPRPGCETDLKEAVESLLTDVVYFYGKKHYPELICKEIKKRDKPYEINLPTPKVAV